MAGRGRLPGGQRRGRPRVVVSDEIWATIIDLVNHGLSLREAGLQFLSRFGAFLRSKVQFLILLVQIPNHLVTCAHH